MNRGAIIFVVTLCAALVVAVWVLRTTKPRAGSRQGERPAATDGRDGKRHPSTRIRTVREQHPKTIVRPAQPPRHAQTSPTLPQDAPTVLVTGYVVDSFRGMRSFPAGYNVQGMALTGQGLTLAPGTAGGRIGTLESPPLPLRQPSTDLTLPGRTELADRASLQVEISASPDGQRWSGWYLIERNTPGQADAAGQAMDAAVQEALAARATGGAEPAGPSIKYRLTMTAFETTCPVVRDLRVWRRPVPADADELASELDRLAKDTSATTAP